MDHAMNDLSSHDSTNSDIVSRNARQLATADPWVTSSLLHKAIRRDDPVLAEAAARRFMHLRRSAIWRRLIVIAFEDIGVAGTGLVATLVTTANNAQGRALNAEDERSILALVRSMAESPKDRGADYLNSAVRLHPALEAERERAGTACIQGRLDLVADPTLPLASRAVAGWYAAGVDSLGEARLGVGHIDALFEVLQTLGIPADLLSATKAAVNRTREPMCLMVPLVWHSAFKDGTPPAVDCRVPVSPVINEIPMYAFDCHTRIGKAAVRRFARENPAMQNWAESFVPDHRVERAACLGAFFTDAAPVARRLGWTGSEALERLGIEADMLGAGIPREGISPLLKVFADNLGHLNAVRAELFSARAK
jgi:hypothetical protein